MVDAKLTALSAATSSTSDDLLYIVDDPSGTPASYKITKGNFFKFADGGVLYDSNGNEILNIVATSSAVNEVTFTNGATGVPAKISASGETNIGILLTGKGTGKIQIGDAADATKLLTFELVGATTAKTMTFTSSHTDDRTITFPDATDTLVGKATNDTLTNKTLTAPKLANGGFIADANGNELIKGTTVSSAVNEIDISNNSTGVMPIIKSSGETNIGLQISPKGTGKVTITDGTDLTKKVDFNVSGVTTSTTRTITIPDASDTLVGKATTDTLTNKTIDGDNNTVSNLAIGSEVLTTLTQTEEIWIPAGAFISSTTNGADITSRETTTNDVNYTYAAFDTTTSESAWFTWTPPANWNAGTVRFKLYWTNTAGESADTIDFDLAAVAFSDDDALDTAVGTAANVTDTWIAQGDLHISAYSAAITIAGSPVAGEEVHFKLSRDVASDDLAGDADVIGVLLEYTVNDIGTT